MERVTLESVCSVSVTAERHGRTQKPAGEQQRQRFVPLDQLQHRPGRNIFSIFHAYTLGKHLVGIACLFAKGPLGLAKELEGIAQNQVRVWRNGS